MEPIHSSTAEKNENQTPVQDQRCQSGPSAKKSVIPSEGDSTKNDGADQQHVHHSQREGLSVGQSSSSVSERTGRPVGERGRDLLSQVVRMHRLELCWTQKERILAECQAEINRHEFQTAYDRRSLLKLGEIVESQREVLHCAQAEELQRRDQQLLQGQLLQQNLELREAHQKSLNEMEELKKFQSSTFDTIAS